MAFIPDFKEAVGFVNSWLAEGERGKRFLKQAALDHRANLEAVKRNGGMVGGHSAAEYEQSVTMLERTVLRF
jgi:hypothetical protein